MMEMSGHKNNKNNKLLQNIIQIQANVRGWAVRRRLSQIKKLLHGSHEKGEFDASLDE